MRADTTFALGKVLTLRELGTARACRPSCILDPLREEFLALLPARPDRHPLGCHRRRIDDRIVFDKIVVAVVFGCGYERLGDASCSATTLRRRRDERTAPGVFDRLRLAALNAYETMIGLELGRSRSAGGSWPGTAPASTPPTPRPTPSPSAVPGAPAIRRCGCWR
jgi:hypothetical protein